MCPSPQLSIENNFFKHHRSGIVKKFTLHHKMKLILYIMIIAQ